MSKKKAPKPGKHNSTQPKNRSSRKAVVVIALMLILSVSGLILAQWRALRPAASPLSLAPVPQPSPTLQLSKEYIYAGERLIATEEPTSSGGSDSGNAPTNLAANATSGTTVSLTWTAPAGSVTSYQVERSQSINGPFTTLSPNPTTTSFTDSTASAGVAYLYRVRAAFTGGGYSSYSNKDLATTIIFTDDPLIANETTIQATHFEELRLAINAVRTTAGLGASTWTDASLFGIFINDVHVQEMRTSLDQARSALSMTAPTYTDTSLPGIFIKKNHIEELRTGVK
jgi:Fibronectin type III domain